MSQKTALIASIVMGFVAVVLLQVEVRGGSVTVYRVMRDAQHGTTLRGGIVRASVPKSAYAALASNVPTEEFEQWVQTTPLVRDVHAGDTVTFDMFLVTAGEGVRIAPGMRAVGVQVRNGAQSAGFLAQPGDLVDVLATVPAPEGETARTILQAKKVLAVDQVYRRDDSSFVRGRTYSTVTIEVTPAEAELLEGSRTVAQDGFSLALRNRADTVTVATSGFTVGSKK